jgi:PAS domain S-box-containing protein
VIRQDSALRLAVIVQSSRDAIVSVNLDGVILTWNPAAERMFGLTEAEVVGMSIGLLVPPELRDEQQQILSRVIAGEHIEDYETVRVANTEQRLEVSMTLSPLKDVTGRIVGASGIIRDVNEQKRSQKALERRLEFERFLFDLSKTFLGLPEEEIDLNMERGLAHVGEFLHMDRVTLLELSRERGEMTVVYSWSAPGVARAAPVLTTRTHPWWMGQIMRGEMSLASSVDDLPEEAVAERAYLRQRGVASAASIPLRVGGDIAGAITFVTVRDQVSWTPDLLNQLRAIGDILWNALKRHHAMQAMLNAQEVLRESEERFRLAMQNVASGLYTLDLNGMVTYVNPSAENMFGWTNTELLGRKMHDVTHHKHPDGTPFQSSDCPVLQVLQKGVELRDHEDWFIRKDGSFFPVVFSSSPLKHGRTTIGIVVGFRDDTTRREAERAVRESEERFRLMADTAPVMIWMSGVDKHCDYFNRPWLEFTGRSLEAELGDGWVEGVHHEDRKLCINTYSQAFDRREPFRMDYRLRRFDGEYRWVLDSGVPRFARDGFFAGYIGSAIDVTDRRLAHEALSNFSRRLMQAQEKERAFVARELHDDIGQRATALVWQLQALVRRLPSETKEHGLVQTMCDQAIELAKVIPAMSHRLHSVELQSFGMAVASERLCKELSEMSKVQIEFLHDGISPNLSEDVAICLFRVLQEALNNAVKHARVRHIFVSLRGTANEIELNVIDEGIGFDSTASNARQGLGFVSMKERLSLIGGEVLIDSRIGSGTTVRARVPLSDPKAQPR